MLPTRVLFVPFQWPSGMNPIVPGGHSNSIRPPYDNTVLRYLSFSLLNNGITSTKRLPSFFQDALFTDADANLIDSMT
jgi:hypothetical protein